MDHLKWEEEQERKGLVSIENRCPHCRKLLFKGMAVRIRIKCTHNECGAILEFSGSVAPMTVQAPKAPATKQELDFRATKAA